MAQKVAMLQIQLSEKEDITEKLKTTISELQAEHAKTKSEYESTVTRHQKFIDKVNNIKKNVLLFVYQIIFKNIFDYLVIEREKTAE